jgi:hypothetical protein
MDESVAAKGSHGLKQQLEQWSERCLLWLLQGVDAGGHSLKNSTSEFAVRAKEEWKDAQEKIKFEQSGGYCYCYVLQPLCHKWAQRRPTGQWEERPGKECQFKNVVMQAVIRTLVLAEPWPVGVINCLALDDRVDVGKEVNVW